MHSTQEMVGAMSALTIALPDPVMIQLMRGEYLSSVVMQMTALEDVARWRGALTGMDDIDTSPVDITNRVDRYVFNYRGIEFVVFCPIDLIIVP